LGSAPGFGQRYSLVGSLSFRLTMVRRYSAARKDFFLFLLVVLTYNNNSGFVLFSRSFCACSPSHHNTEPFSSCNKQETCFFLSKCLVIRNKKQTERFDREHHRTIVDVLPVASGCECPYSFFTVDYGSPGIRKETHHTAWLKIWSGIFADYPPNSLLTIVRGAHLHSSVLCFLVIYG
jgi:hypothetical protein